MYPQFCKLWIILNLKQIDPPLQILSFSIVKQHPFFTLQ